MQSCATLAFVWSKFAIKLIFSVLNRRKAGNNMLYPTRLKTLSHPTNLLSKWGILCNQRHNLRPWQVQGALKCVSLKDSWVNQLSFWGPFLHLKRTLMGKTRKVRLSLFLGDQFVMSEGQSNHFNKYAAGFYFTSNTLSQCHHTINFNCCDMYKDNSYHYYPESIQSMHKTTIRCHSGHFWPEYFLQHLWCRPGEMTLNGSIPQIHSKSYVY